MIRARRNIFITYFVFVGITLILWVLAKPNTTQITRFPTLSLVQALGLTAASLVALNLILASRLKFLEQMFGGLDKVYKQHRLTGELAFVFMLAHPSLLLVDAFPSLELIIYYTVNLSDAALNYGKLAFAGFVTIIILTLFARIPYHIWLRIHQLMIIPLIFLTLHVFTVSSDVAVFMPLRVWMLGILVFGIVIYVYKVLLYKFVGPKHEYEITNIALRGMVTEFILKPLGKPLNFEPGQFVFTKFTSPQVTREEHPFSISSSPSEDTIRLSIKKSGDFTSTLPKLKQGDKALLYGPYGQFGRRALASNKDLILIAGGIGITPFLSLVNYISDHGMNKNYKLIYSYKNEADSTYKEELAKVCGGRLITHNSDKNGHLTGEAVKRLGGGVEGKLILLCGPKGMMMSLTNQFLKMGVKRSSIIYEDFDLKG